MVFSRWRWSCGSPRLCRPAGWAQGDDDVEADQALTLRPMQGERVVEPVRLLGRDDNPGDDEPAPVTAVRVHHQDLAVEVEEGVERWVTGWRHRIWLSRIDNSSNAVRGCQPSRSWRPR